MIIHTLGFMLTALSNSDKAGFIARSTTDFAKVAEPQFDGIAAVVAPHLRSGYKLEHLTDLKRRGGSVAVFKIIFTDSADDMVAMISETDGMVTGLTLK